MNVEEFSKLGEVVSAASVRALLGIKSNRDWSKIRQANPRIVWKIPGMRREKYLRVEVIKLLPRRKGDE